jgi:hypothetical protein
MKKLLKRYSNLFLPYLFGRILLQKRKKRTRRNKTAAMEKTAKKQKKQPKNPNPMRKTKRKMLKNSRKTTPTKRNTFLIRKWTSHGEHHSASTRYTSPWRRWSSQCPSQDLN